MSELDCTPMKIRLTHLVLSIAVILLGTACVDKRPSYAQLEVEKAEASFPELTAWVNSNRAQLAELAAEIQQQTVLDRLIWSHPPEFFTAILRDGTVTDGRLDDPSWPQDIRDLIRAWHSRLVNAGCHGFDDQGSDRALRLFLDVNIYIAMPAPANFRYVEHYADWAKKGLDPRGDYYSDIGGGWYLCTERR